MSFTNKLVIITGGNSGIGTATAVLFATQGADVVIVGRNEERLNAVALKCEAVGNKPLVIKADVSKDDDAKAIIKQTIGKFGKLDVLVNNAGILRKTGVFEDTFMETFDEVMNTNVRSIVHLTSLAASYLVKTKGNIINISSVAATTPVTLPDYAAYKTSKAAVSHFTKSMALELATQGVRVNAVSPGITKTDIFHTAGVTDLLENASQFSALGKSSDSEEIADLIMYLASDKAKSITGSDYVIDNGYLLK